MSTAALESALAELHSEYARFLTDQLKLAESGEIPIKELGPLLNNIRQFLKDNHIEAEAETDGTDAFTRLTQETLGDNVLPFAK